jgi:DNA adenine methylase
MQKCDRPSTFFYLDPPYFNRPYYRFNFDETDYVKMAEYLGKLKGKFILSLNDVPEIRRIFADFNMTTLQMTYSAQRNAGKSYHELLISNYRLPRGDG